MKKPVLRACIRPFSRTVYKRRLQAVIKTYCRNELHPFYVLNLKVDVLAS